MEYNLLKYNRHWEKGFTYPYPKKRAVFPTLISLLKAKQIIELTGLRRVGKSTLLFQLINHLVEKTKNPYLILYFTFDEEKPNIESLLENYTQQSQINFKEEKIYVFLDEIQKLPDFESQLKVYYDLYPNIKFTISGSTGLFIRKKNRESLAGRIFPYFLTPPSFLEYLYFREKEEMLQKALLFEKELEREFTGYLSGQFIESINIKDPGIKKEYYREIVKKIIYEDLPSVFKFDNPDILYRLIQYIAQKPGCLINNLHLAHELNISNKTLALYLYYLENSFLINKLYNFSRNLISSEKKLKKYYLSSPSFSSSLTDFIDTGALFENYLSSVSLPKYFSRDPFGHEVDFIYLQGEKEILPTECKFIKNVGKNDLHNLSLFMKKYSLPVGNIVYKGVQKKTLHQKNQQFNLIPYFAFNPQFSARLH